MGKTSPAKVKGMKTAVAEMSDRERIVMHLAAMLASSSPLGGCGYPKGLDAGRLPHFRFPQKGEPKAGQIVVATSSAARQTHAWVLAECVGRGDPGKGYSERDVPKIRAFGDPEEKWIYFFNESFYIYQDDDWKSHPVFFEGWKRGFYERLMRYLKDAGDTWKYRFCKLTFGPEGTATVLVRAHIFFEGKEPFEIQIPAGPKVLKRDIVAALKAGGFGSKYEVENG